jgi:hypothetical protein
VILECGTVCVKKSFLDLKIKQIHLN